MNFLVDTNVISEVTKPSPNGTERLIAATAVEHQLTLVTRNTSHFAALPVQLLNPWTI